MRFALRSQWVPLASLPTCFVLAACSGNDAVLPAAPHGSLDAGAQLVPPAPDAGAQDAAILVPAQLLDLTHTSLTLPIKADGTEGGYPAETLPASQVSPPDHPERGYTSKYFFADHDPNGDGVSFFCPITGAANSPDAPHPRSELRHQVTPGKNDGWLPSSPADHAMSATLAVKKAPPGSGEVIIGQIHGLTQVSGPGAGTNAYPLLLISFIYDFTAATGTVKATVKGNPDDSNSPPSTSFTLQQGVHLGDLIHYEVHAHDGAVTVNGTKTLLSSAWDGVQGYFKAGAYVQSVGSDATQGGLVTFYALKITAP